MASKRSSPAPLQTHVLNAPTQTFGRLYGLILRFRKVPGPRQKGPYPLPQTAGGVVILEPLGSDRRDPNTLAPNRRKLGRLQRARQGLVRVPESNTKYGGGGGKPGGIARARYAQVSVSPEGFPNEKIRLRSAATEFAPLFTGELFIVPDILLVEDSPHGPEMSGQACSRAGGLNPREAAR
jgi:hypothetical protein